MSSIDHSAHPTRGHVDSVNVGAPRHLEWEGRIVETSIWKQPVKGPVPVRGMNLRGDDQADRRVHGGPDKAVYAYSSEDYVWWASTLGNELTPGIFGENLTVSGLALGGALVGERWQVGSTILEVSQPRLPCFKLGIRMGDSGFVESFETAERFGAYLRIVEEGHVETGDPIEVVLRPDHDLTITELGRSSPHPSADMIERIVAVPQMPDSWREWAERARHRRRQVAG
jgi:MOSC domain-containing protein YiiM